MAVLNKGLKANLPVTGSDDITLYFTTDTNELFKSTGNGQPLAKVSDVYYYETNLPATGDLGKIYILQNQGSFALYVWTGTEFLGLSSGAGGSGVNVTQFNETITGAPETKTYTVPIDADNKRAPVEVLVFVAGSSGIVQVVNTFDNTDETDFEPNDYVEFDGTMKLKTQYIDIVVGTTLGAGTQFVWSIDSSVVKTINSIQVGVSE